MKYEKIKICRQLWSTNDVCVHDRLRWIGDCKLFHTDHNWTWATDFDVVRHDVQGQTFKWKLDDRWYIQLKMFIFKV